MASAIGAISCLILDATERSNTIQTAEILKHLSNTVGNPTSDVIQCITMQNVITEIVNRLGDEALELSAEDLQLAREEVLSTGRFQFAQKKGPPC